VTDGDQQVIDSVDIAAPPPRVWELVTDIALMPELSRELLGVQWAEGFSGPAVGAQFLGRNRNPVIGEWTTCSTIVAFDEHERFGWAVGDPESPAATWLFELTPIAEGTRLSYTARLGPGPSGVTMLIAREPHRGAEIVSRRLGQWRTGVAATLAGIRDRAENRV
jgi:hypothetical protein